MNLVEVCLLVEYDKQITFYIRKRCKVIFLMIISSKLFDGSNDCGELWNGSIVVLML